MMMVRQFCEAHPFLVRWLRMHGHDGCPRGVAAQVVVVVVGSVDLQACAGSVSRV